MKLKTSAKPVLQTTAQRRLYDQLLQKLKVALGSESKGLTAYRTKYESQFRAQKWQLSHRDELLRQFQDARFVFLADFHALVQSQKGHLRILKALSGIQQRILAVEFIEKKYQKELDQFLHHQISESDFLKKIKWTEHWGFEWENYKPILLWAQKNKIPVFAINEYHQDRSAKTLQQRDRFSAQALVEIHTQSPEAQVIIIYGELHLAECHLPAELRKQLRKCSPRGEAQEFLFVHQNIDQLYFQIQDSGRAAQTDVVRSGEGQFCVLNIAPWVKWQSYLHFLEKNLQKNEDHLEPDPTEMVAHYLKILALELNLSYNEKSFSIYLANEDSLQMIFDQLRSVAKVKFLKEMIANGISFYLPEIQVGVLAEQHENHFVVLAMSILHAQSSHRHEFEWKIEKNFQVHIWRSALEYFGSKLINPKRKSATLNDLQDMIAVRSAEESVRIAYQFKLQELAYLRSSPQSVLKVKVPPAKKKISVLRASKILGAMLGEKVFFALQKQLLTMPVFDRMLKKETHLANFATFYAEMLEMIESLPAPFRSKKERL